MLIRCLTSKQLATKEINKEKKQKISRGIETLIEDEEDASATNNELRGIDKRRESGRVRLLILLKGLSEFPTHLVAKFNDNLF